MTVKYNVCQPFLGLRSFVSQSVRFDSLEVHIDIRHDEFQSITQKGTARSDVLDLVQDAPALIDCHKLSYCHVRSYGPRVVRVSGED